MVAATALPVVKKTGTATMEKIVSSTISNVTFLFMILLQDVDSTGRNPCRPFSIVTTNPLDQLKKISMLRFLIITP
jgi:hypothetical protein